MLDLTSFGGLLVIAGGVLVLWRWFHRFAVLAGCVAVLGIGLVWLLFRHAATL